MKAYALLLVLLTVTLPCSVAAVETAERISDREIIESLAEIKGQLKVIDQRFNAVDQRFETMQRTMDERFIALNDNVDRIWSLMLVVIAGIFGLIGFIIWDRYSILRPLLSATQKNLSGTDFRASPEGVRRMDVPNNLGQKTSKIG